MKARMAFYKQYKVYDRCIWQTKGMEYMCRCFCLTYLRCCYCIQCNLTNKRYNERPWDLISSNICSPSFIIYQFLHNPVAFLQNNFSFMVTIVQMLSFVIPRNSIIYSVFGCIEDKYKCPKYLPFPYSPVFSLCLTWLTEPE